MLTGEWGCALVLGDDDSDSDSDICAENAGFRVYSFHSFVRSFVVAIGGGAFKVGGAILERRFVCCLLFLRNVLQIVRRYQI